MVAYETGVSTSPADLLAKLVTFAESNGWSGDVPASGDIVLSNGSSGVGIFAGIDATTTGWQTRACRGYSAGAAWNAQPGNAGATHTMNLGAGPYTSYHFWVGDEGGRDYLHVTVEKTAGQFRHWILGELIKFGTWDGGPYSDSTFLSDTDNDRNQPDNGNHRTLADANSGYLQTAVWADYDGGVNEWRLGTHVGDFTTDRVIGSCRSSGIYSPQIFIGYQRWNFRTPQWPLIYFANRASSQRSPLGRIPNLRWLNMRNFFPGQEVTIGSDQWKIFPVFTKQLASVANTIVSSGTYAYAHLMP